MMRSIATSALFFVVFTLFAIGKCKQETSDETQPRILLETSSNNHMATYYLDSLEGQAIGGNRPQSQVILGPVIGQGSYADVHLAKRISDGKLFAVKIQSIDEENERKDIMRISRENSLLRHLSYYPGFMKPLFFESSKQYAYIGLPLLGPSLYELMGMVKGKKFTEKTILMIAKRLVQHLQILHTSRYLHTDLKPQNFLIGIHPDLHDQIYLVDLGLALKYTDSKGNIHPFQTKRPALRGSVRYCSVGVHKGHQLSRKDDLESLAYVLFYMYHDSLPWQQGRVNFNSSFSAVGKIKAATNMTRLSGNIKSLQRLIQVSKDLGHDETPPYAEIIASFDSDLLSRGLYDDGQFDWIEQTEVHQDLVTLYKYYGQQFASEKTQAQNREDMQMQTTDRSYTTTRDIIHPNSTWTTHQSFESIINWRRKHQRSEEQKHQSIRYVFWTHAERIGEVIEAVSVNSSHLGRDSILIAKTNYIGSLLKRFNSAGKSLKGLFSHPHNDTALYCFAPSASFWSQGYIHSEAFPALWIESQWRRRRFISAITANKHGYSITTTLDKCIRQQTVLFTLEHPPPQEALYTHDLPSHIVSLGQHRITVHTRPTSCLLNDIRSGE